MPRRTDEELVQSYKEGDQIAVDILFDRYKIVVRGIARTKFLIGGDEEDLIQEGMIGLYKAIRDYDFASGASFGTFARLCIQRQIYKAIEASNSQKNKPLNDFVSFSEEGWELYETGVKESPEALVIEAEKEELLLTRLKQGLSPMENKVLDKYLEGQDYREIATDMNKAPKSIDNALQRIRKKASLVQKETVE